MQCWETAKIMSLVGIVFVLIGGLMFFVKNLKVKTSLDISAAAVSAVGFFIPAKLVGGCMDAGMACHTTAFPIIYGLLICMLCAALASIGKDFLAVKKRGSTPSIMLDNGRCVK